MTVYSATSAKDPRESNKTLNTDTPVVWYSYLEFIMVLGTPDCSRGTVTNLPHIDHKLAETRRRLLVCEDTVRLRQDDRATLSHRSLQLTGQLMGPYVEKHLAKTNAKVFGAVGALSAGMLTASHFLSSMPDIHSSLLVCGSMFGIVSGMFLISSASMYARATRQARPLEQQAAQLQKTVQAAQTALDAATAERIRVIEEIRHWEQQRAVVRMVDSTPPAEGQIRLDDNTVVVGDVRVPRRPETVDMHSYPIAM